MLAVTYSLQLPLRTPYM